jgi:hypothetical protein
MIEMFLLMNKIKNMLTLMMNLYLVSDQDYERILWIGKKRQDANGAFWIRSEHSECFDTVHSIFVVEVPVKHYGLPEVIQAKKTEIDNLRFVATFEEIDDVGQDTVGS